MPPAAAPMIRAPRPAQARAQWPGLSVPGTAAANDVMNGRLPDPNRWRVRRHKFYHRVDYAAAGATSIQLFNVAPSDFICNMPAQGQLGAEQFFKTMAIRIVPETGITSAANGATTTNAVGTDAANGHQSTTRTSALTTVDTVAGVLEDLRQVFAAGSLTIKYGDQPVVDAQFGLHNFPAGSMPTADLAYSAGQAANTTLLSAIFKNGEASNTNGWFLTPAVPLLPQKPVRGELRWQTAVAVSDAFVLRIELEGILLTPANG